MTRFKAKSKQNIVNIGGCLNRHRFQKAVSKGANEDSTPATVCSYLFD